MTVVSVGGMGVLAIWLTMELSLGWQIVIAMAGAALGFVIPVGVLFVVMWCVAFPRQRDEARAAITTPTGVADQAYAEAWRVKADVDRRAGFARRWLGDEVTLEALKSAEAPMASWDTSKALFADVLAHDAWISLVRTIEEFNQNWERYHTLTQRAGEVMRLSEKKAFLANLHDASESLISAAGGVDASLAPLLELGSGA